jgi:hypothetical protein
MPWSRDRGIFFVGGYRTLLWLPISLKRALLVAVLQRRRTDIRHRCRLTGRLRWQASSYRGGGARTLQRMGRPVRPPRVAFAVYAPSRGRVEVLRSGQPGHGWPMAAGPRSRTGARACRALARHRTTGARALGYLGPGGVPFFQVTRRKGGTVSRRDRKNGYVHNQTARSA